MNILRPNLKDQLLWLRRLQAGMFAVSLVLGGAIYVHWIRPENAGVDAARQQAADAESELQRAQVRTRSLPMVEAEIAGLRSRIARFDKELPHGPGLAQFITDVTRISQGASLKRFAWQVDSRPQLSDHLTELPVRLTFEGDFKSGVLRFLRDTEDMQRLMRVRKLELKADESHEGQVAAELTMNIYCGDQ